ncbi:MAG: beta-lactamase induction protein [Rhodanobacteraceae bacterium]
MAITLLAVLLVAATSYAAPELARLRDFSWLHIWLERWSGPTESERQVRLAWLVPVLLIVVCGLIQLLLRDVQFGLPAFIFAVVVLFYCWGPRELEADVDTVLKAPDNVRRSSAVQNLRAGTDGDVVPLEAAALVEASFVAALTRWFGVVFWFVLLGPVGALAYRVVQLIARDGRFGGSLDSAEHDRFVRVATALDWAPAHLMALTLALVSDFDTVLATWRNYHAAHGRGYFTLDLGFLGALARAGVDADVLAGDGYAADISDPMIELADARTVLRRVLLTWLAVIALLVLASWVR